MAAPRTLKLSLKIAATLLFLLLFPLNLSYAVDSIAPSQSLSGSDILVSEGYKFELGFFQPGNSPYHYLGIWYSQANVSGLTPVWVANRDSPITDPRTAELKIDSYGNVVLSNDSNPLIWSTNCTTITSKSTVASLLDTGNFVLRNGSNRNSHILWQSFDHPTHTWLPGAKIGWNKVTGEVRRLISWRNEDDPAPGTFSFAIDPNETGQFFISWNCSYDYWTSGVWDGQKFNSTTDMTASNIYDYQYVSEATEEYFSYSMKNGSSLVTRFVMNFSGQIEQLTWVPRYNRWISYWSLPRGQCQVHALCGPFGSCNENAKLSCNCVKGFSAKSPSEWNTSDWSGGCVRNTPLQCGKYSSSGVKQDGFYEMANVRFPDNSLNLNVSSASNCELTCLNNCSCTAFSYGDTSGCSVWYGDLLDLQEQYLGTDGGTIFLRLAASEPSHSGNNKGVIIGLVIGGVTCSVIILIVILLFIRPRRKSKQILKTQESGLVAFRYSDLQRMTNNFSDKLGGGGFGTVFKGVFPDSTYIAVKKLEGIKQGEKQFWAEVRTIGTTQHVNLVRLHGFCSEGNKKLLVYEYMPNGSLQSQLFQNDTSEVLNWETRYQIALGMAQGLTYLHDHCRDCIIHCDIKPENILLDDSFVPKIGDFGLAKLLGRDFSSILTTMRGTIGYLAPEWISDSAITAKADVYSYGMMLFEIISGKRNVDTIDAKPGFIPTLAASKLIEGDITGLVDHRIAGDANLEEVTRLCKVACWCIQDHVNSRPTMRQVVHILEGILPVNMPPVPKILQILTDHSGIVSFSELPSNSSQQMEITSSSSETCTRL